MGRAVTISHHTLPVEVEALFALQAYSKVRGIVKTSRTKILMFRRSMMRLRLMSIAVPGVLTRTCASYFCPLTEVGDFFTHHAYSQANGMVETLEPWLFLIESPVISDVETGYWKVARQKYNCPRGSSGKSAARG